MNKWDSFFYTDEPWSLFLIWTPNIEKHDRRSFWFSWKNSLQVNNKIKRIREKKAWLCSTRWNVILQDREIHVDCCKCSSKIVAVLKRLPAKILGFMPVIIFSFLLRNPAPAGRFVCVSSNEPFLLDNDVPPIKNLTEMYDQRIERGKTARELLREVLYSESSNLTDAQTDIVNWFTYDKYGGMFWDYAQGSGKKWSEESKKWKLSPEFKTYCERLNEILVTLL